MEKLILERYLDGGLCLDSAVLVMPEEVTIEHVFENKGERKDWEEDSDSTDDAWPPRKIRITIEEIVDESS